MRTDTFLQGGQENVNCKRYILKKKTAWTEQRVLYYQRKDNMYKVAMRVVCEVGTFSTEILLEYI